MSKRALVLRLLLIVSLLANGIASAVASVAMHGGERAPAPETTQAAKDPAHAGCHEGRAMPTAHEAAPAHGHKASHDVPGTPSADEGSCCRTGLCGCECTTVPVALPAPAWIVAEHEPVANIAWPAFASHRPPALPHLIRPPIG